MTIHIHLQHIADSNDASILIDEQGDIAVQRRHYDQDGIQVPVHRPDPCDFLPESRWLEMSVEHASRRVC